MESSILYWCVLYLAYVLLPVIPAVIIYKNFPDTKVGVKGILSGMKINATGAFAAYIITALLGVFIIKKAFVFIEDAASKTWTITSRVRFVDENNKPLPLEANELEKMTALTNVVFNPPPDSGATKSSARFQYKIISEKVLPCVMYSYCNGDFVSPAIDLDTVKAGKNTGEREISLGTIYLKKTRNPYQSDQSRSFVSAGPPINQ